MSMLPGTRLLWTQGRVSSASSTTREPVEKEINMILDKIVKINITKRYVLTILIALWLFPFAGCSSQTQDRAKLKEELKREILAELRQQRQAPEQTAVMLDQEQLRAQMKEEIEREILAKIQNQIQTQVQEIASDLPSTGNRSIQWQAVSIGSAEGRILRKGHGLAGCKVKLIRIMKPQSVVEMFNTIKEGAEFTTVTDEQGKYVFEKLPVGAYKLKWQLPDDTGWIRRLKDKPDAVIAEGQTAVLKSVETSRRLVGQ